MKSPQKLSNHLQTHPICERNPEPPDDRISPQHLQELNFNGGPFARQKNIEGKWKVLSRILFPAEEQVPSPFYRSYTTPLFKEIFSRRLDQALAEEFGTMYAPVTASIQRRLPELIRQSEEEATRASRNDASSSESAEIEGEVGGNNHELDANQDPPIDASIADGWEGLDEISDWGFDEDFNEPYNGGYGDFL